MKDFQLTFHSASDQRGLDHKTTTRVRKFLCFFDDPSGKSGFLLEFRRIFSNVSQLFRPAFTLRLLCLWPHDDFSLLFIWFCFSFLTFYSAFRRLHMWNEDRKEKHRNEAENAESDFPFQSSTDFSLRIRTALYTFGFFLHLIDKTNLLPFARGEWREAGALGKLISTSEQCYGITESLLHREQWKIFNSLVFISS